MPIDPSIALGVKPVQFESPINQMAKVYELQNMQQSSQANQLAMQERQRAIAEDEAVRNYFAQQDRSSPDFVKGLYGVSPKIGQAYEKFQAETSKEKTLAKNAELEQITKIHGVLKTGATQVLANPTLANAIRVTQEVGRMTGSDVASDIAELTALGDNPEAIRRWAAGHALEADKLLPKSERVDVGGAINYTNIDPLTGLPTVVGTTKKTATPSELMTNARERERIRQGDRRDVVSHQQVAEDGTVTNFNKFGEIINTVKGAGKPSAQFTKTKEQAKRLTSDLSMAITELENVTKDGGLIDQSTGGYIGKGVDIAARAFNTATPGDIAIGKLQPIADLALKMVPRFEGPQSDKDTMSYKQAAGQLADASVPTEVRKNAGKEVLRLMKLRKNQFVTQDMAQEGVTPVNAGIDTSAIDAELAKRGVK
jgi:hypothetical protein